MSETTQPGVRVDENTWHRFRQFVQDQHGGIRGNLRTELEAALQNHMDAAHGPNELQRIENDVATIKAMLAEGEADGGVVAPTPTPSDADNTRTRQTEKPKPNEPRSKKIDYLINVIETDPAVDESGGELAERNIRNIIESEYGFEGRTEDEYFDMILERIDAAPHPLHGKTLVWGDRLEKAREDAKKQASDEMNTVSD